MCPASTNQTPPGWPDPLEIPVHRRVDAASGWADHGAEEVRSHVEARLLLWAAIQVSIWIRGEVIISPIANSGDAEEDQRGVTGRGEPDDDEPAPARQPEEKEGSARNRLEHDRDRELQQDDHVAVCETDSPRTLRAPSTSWETRPTSHGPTTGIHDRPASEAPVELRSVQRTCRRTGRTG